MTTTEMNFKLKKLKNKSLRKLIISSLQLLLILFAILGIILILKNVVQPIFNEVKNSENLFKNFNGIVKDLEAIQKPEDLFAPDGSGYFILPDLSNIRPEDFPIFQESVKNAFLKFQGDFDRIFQQLNNLEPDKIFTQANRLISDVLQIIPQFGQDLGIEVGQKSQDIIERVLEIQKLANNINNLTTEWISMPFDRILEIFQNDISSADLQTILNENLDTIIKSKLAIMLIIILVSLVLVILFLLWLIPSAFKMKVSNWRLDDEQKIPGILTTINILFAFIFVLGPISWFLINRSFSYKYNKSLKINKIN